MMIKATLALVALTVGAQADMPSPLFCITLELCETVTNCQPHRTSQPFVLRQTDGEWVQHYGPRGTDTWVFIAGSADAAHAEAPEGVRVALVEAGETPEGRILLHEHRLEEDALSLHFLRHQCETSSEEAAS